MLKKICGPGILKKKFHVFCSNGRSSGSIALRSKYPILNNALNVGFLVGWLNGVLLKVVH